MTLNENKKKTIVRTGGTLAVVTSVALNLITVLDWFGISPKESARNTQYVQAVQEVEYAPLAVDYGLQEVSEVTIIDNYAEYVIEEPVQELAPIEVYAVPEEEEAPVEYDIIYADQVIPQDTPQILNAVQLTNMTYSDASDINGGFALRSSGTDNLGNTYFPVLLTDTPVLLTSQHEYLRYNQYELNSQYHTFAGTVFLSAESALTTGTAYFEVYGDGALLDCYAFTSGSRPEKFEIDVTDVDVLEIRSAVSSDDIIPVIGLANAFFAYY